MDDAGPAKKAGLRVGDIILNLDKESVSSIDDIYRILGEWPVGEAMKVSALRGKNLKEFSVTPIEAAIAERLKG